jgi:hypothetical protein
MVHEERASIDVKQAVRTAIEFVKDVYSDEKITNVGLEEVKSEGDVWKVTVGFSRPWDYPKVQRKTAYDSRTVYDSIAQLYPKPDPGPDRDYKVVKVDAATGDVRGMEIRDE